MKHISYDGTFPGFLTALFQTKAYEEYNEEISFINSNTDQNLLFRTDAYLATDLNTAREFFKLFKRKISTDAACLLHHSFLYEHPHREEVLLYFIKQAFSSGPAVSAMFGDPEIKTVMEWANAVEREKHRYMGILRFNETYEGFYRADFEPRYNICGLLTEHFSERMQQDFWMIVDRKRQHGIFHCPGNKEILQLSNLQEIEKVSPAQGFSGKYESLWKNYFEVMEIKERKNSRCQQNFIPKRDRNYLPEFHY